MANDRTKPLRLSRLDVEPLGEPSLASPDAQSGESPGASSTRERREVIGAAPPDDVLPFDSPVAEMTTGDFRDASIDQGAHVDVDALLVEAGDRAIVDPAGDDVAPQVVHVGREVQVEPCMLRHGRSNPNRGDLPRVGAISVDPDSGIPIESSGAQPEVSQSVDHHPFDPANVIESPCRSRS